MRRAVLHDPLAARAFAALHMLQLGGRRYGDGKRISEVEWLRHRFGACCDSREPGDGRQNFSVDFLGRHARLARRAQRKAMRPNQVRPWREGSEDTRGQWRVRSLLGVVFCSERERGAVECHERPLTRGRDGDRRRARRGRRLVCAAWELRQRRPGAAQSAERTRVGLLRPAGEPRRYPEGRSTPLVLAVEFLPALSSKSPVWASMDALCTGFPA